MKYPLILSLWLLSLKPALGCDVCGCGIRDGSVSMGLTQSIPSNIFLASWQQFGYQTDFRESSSDDLYRVQDLVNRYSIQYIHQINKKTQLNLSSSIQQTQRHNTYNQNQTSSIIALGDLFTSLNYKILDNRNNIFSKQQWFWMIGATLKLPTGHYQARDQNKARLPMHLQAGNGSYSQGIQNFLSLRWKSWGISTQYQLLNYASNELDYQQGRNQLIQLGVNKTIFRNKKYTVVPMVSWIGQWIRPDREFNQMVPHTGGQFQNVQFQVEWIYKNAYIMIQHARPIIMSIPSNAPQIQSTSRLSVGWVFSERMKDK
ncbi:MAG: hypothetical protein ACPGCV_01560 [Bacteroidia bacterium]